MHHDARIGAGVIILPYVTIGKYSVIGAGVIGFLRKLSEALLFEG